MTNPAASILARVVQALPAQTTSPPVAAGAFTTATFREDLSQVKQDTVDTAAWLTKFATEWGLKLVGVILVLVGAWMIAAWARRTLYKVLNRPHFDQTLIRFLSNLARWSILVLALVACLTTIGIAPKSLAAIVGAAGLAIGLAIQGSLSNLAAGIMLLLLRPFAVGDTVIVAGQKGVVDDIELFNTKLDTSDNRRVIVPNGQIFGSVIENLTHHRDRCVQVSVTVERSADVDQTRGVLLAAAQAVPGRLESPAPSVILQNLAGGGVEWQVQVWAATRDFGAIRQRLLQEMRSALIGAKINLPVQQLEIRHHGGGNDEHRT